MYLFPPECSLWSNIFIQPHLPLSFLYDKASKFYFIYPWESGVYID